MASTKGEHNKSVDEYSTHEQSEHETSEHEASEHDESEEDALDALIDKDAEARTAEHQARSAERAEQFKRQRDAERLDGLWNGQEAKRQQVRRLLTSPCKCGSRRGYGLCCGASDGQGDAVQQEARLFDTELDKWECGQCTFLNLPAADLCEMCSLTSRGDRLQGHRQSVGQA